MRLLRCIGFGCSELRDAEAGVDFDHADVASLCYETHTPFFDGELHSILNAANPPVRMGRGTECKRRKNTLADRKARATLDPCCLLRGKRLDVYDMRRHRIRWCGTGALFVFEPAVTRAWMSVGVSHIRLDIQHRRAV